MDDGGSSLTKQERLACCKLGELLWKGDRELALPPDPVRAVELLRTSVQGGHGHAALVLSDALVQGAPEVPKDVKAARRLLLRAIQAGVPGARERLRDWRD